LKALRKTKPTNEEKKYAAAWSLAATHRQDKTNAGKKSSQVACRYVHDIPNACYREQYRSGRRVSRQR
jgi:hypothetical protein